MLIIQLFSSVVNRLLQILAKRIDANYLTSLYCIVYMPLCQDRYDNVVFLQQNEKPYT